MWLKILKVNTEIHRDNNISFNDWLMFDNIIEDVIYYFLYLSYTTIKDCITNHKPIKINISNNQELYDDVKNKKPIKQRKNKAT